MQCPYCGNEHADTVRFCPETGKELRIETPKVEQPSTCPSCSKQLPANVNFCPYCGTVFSARESSTSYGPPPILPSPPRNRRALIIGFLVCLVIAFIAAGAYFSFKFWPPKPPTSEPITTLVTTPGTPIEPVTEEAILEPSISPTNPGFPEQQPVTEAPSQPTDTPFPTPTIAPTIPPTEVPSPTPIPTATPSLAPQYGWSSEDIFPQQAAGLYTSMVITANGDIHIAYFQDQDDITWYAHNDSGNWESEYVVGGRGKGHHPSLVIDSVGNPLIAYHYVKTKSQLPEAWISYKKAGNWEATRWVQSEAEKKKTALAIGPGDVAYFLYLDSRAMDILYRPFTVKGSWGLSIPVGNASPAIESFSIALSPDGIPHVTFQSAQNGLVYATLQGDVFIPEIVDSSSNAGVYSALAFDFSGNPHIAYFDAAEGVLKYAHRVGDSFEIHTIDPSFNVGRYPSIAVGGNGDVHISYYDETNADLKYALVRGEAWITDIVESAGDAGEWTSLALDPNGLPYISYTFNNDLRLAHAYPLNP